MPGASPVDAARWEALPGSKLAPRPSGGQNWPLIDIFATDGAPAAPAKFAEECFSGQTQNYT
jgi:hypothetical protein